MCHDTSLYQRVVDLTPIERTNADLAAFASLVATAITSIELGNNGYADIGNDPSLIKAIREAGYHVRHQTGLNGLPTHYGYTLAGIQARIRYELSRRP